MNKTDIKTKWGHYMDTDKLVDDMMSLLTKYDHRNTEHGVCCVLDYFFTNKEPLIKLLQKSDCYAGDLRIVLDEKLERRGNARDIESWVSKFPIMVKASDCIKKRIDSNGKTMTDYLKIGKQKISIADLENEDFNVNLSTRNAALGEFTNDGFTRASNEEYNKFKNAVDWFEHITGSTMPAEYVEHLADYNINEGLKTSRAFNKICHHFGVDKAPLYNKEFAKYADMVSGLKRSIKFFISVNPLDYLTMSFGVNWASCHSIDKRNMRHMDNHYSGAYCGGTMSYMCDATSIITYVHNTMPENYEVGKVYRNMFHLGGDGVLLQGRIYPQGNDGCVDLYQEFRSIMQKELAKILELGANRWIRRSSITNIDSVGVHYRDYDYNSNCNISYPTERPQCTEQRMTIGSQRICPHCGRDAEGRLSSSYLSHDHCD